MLYPTENVLEIYAHCMKLVPFFPTDGFSFTYATTRSWPAFWSESVSTTDSVPCIFPGNEHSKHAYDSAWQSDTSFSSKLLISGSGVSGLCRTGFIVQFVVMEKNLFSQDIFGIIVS